MEGYTNVEGGTAIGGYNLQAKTGLTLAECESKCTDFGISCGSFEYRQSDGRCRMNTVVYQQVLDADPDAIKYNSLFELHTRHC